MISIIIPVYNAENYLCRCIESCIRQTIVNIEVIVINDGSTDKSGEILNEFSDRDSRIKVFHRENSGVSVARNFGIGQAKGEWITFVDADDYIASRYLEDFGFDPQTGFPVFTIDKKTLIYQGIFYSDGENISSHFLYSDCDSINNDSVIIEKNMLFMDGCPCAKLFNRKVLVENKIRFDNLLSLHEDHIFVYTYLQYAERIITKSAQNYFYIINQNPNSLTKRKVDPVKLIRAGCLLIHQNKRLFVKYKGIKKSIQKKFITHYGMNQLFRSIFYLLQDDCCPYEVRKTKIREIKEVLTFRFVCSNYSLNYPVRFFGALLFALTPSYMLNLLLNLSKLFK